MYSIASYKRNGEVDMFASGTQRVVTDNNYIKSIKDYVDSICPLEERLENGEDTLVIKIVSEQEAEDFVNNNTIIKTAISKQHKE